MLGDGDGALWLDMAAWCGTERRLVSMLDVRGQDAGLFRAACSLRAGWLPVIQSSIAA